MKKHKYFISFNHTSKNKNGFGNAVIIMKKHFDYNEIESVQKLFEKTYSIEKVVIINFIKL